MAETTYKKGELLLDETVVTQSAYGYNMGMCQTQMRLNQDVLIIEFNETEYECKVITDGSMGYAYGGIKPTGPDFSVYPFMLGNMVSGPSPEEAVITDTISLYTENPGTYSLKIYTAISDSDSTESNPIITYLMTSPSNTNWNVLSSMLGDGDWSKLKAYVETTPHNMNRMVLESLLSGGSGNSNVVGSAVVGTAVAG